MSMSPDLPEIDEIDDVTWLKSGERGIENILESLVKKPNIVLVDKDIL